MCTQAHSDAAMLRRLAFATVLSLSSLPVAAQQVQWLAGPLFYTPATDFVTGFNPNGTGYFLSQATIASPPQPTVGQGFYTRITMAGIASPAAGRLMAVQFVPPAGASVLVDPVNAPCAASTARWMAAGTTSSSPMR
jgi:hypothetical protein